MRLGELIERLDALMREHGDIPVRLLDDGGALDIAAETVHVDGCDSAGYVAYLDLSAAVDPADAGVPAGWDRV